MMKLFSGRYHESSVKFLIYQKNAQFLIVVKTVTVFLGNHTDLPNSRMNEKLVKSCLQEKSSIGWNRLKTSDFSSPIPIFEFIFL